MRTFALPDPALQHRTLGGRQRDIDRWLRATYGQELSHGPRRRQPQPLGTFGRRELGKIRIRGARADEQGEDGRDESEMPYSCCQDWGKIATGSTGESVRTAVIEAQRTAESNYDTFVRRLEKTAVPLPLEKSCEASLSELQTGLEVL